MDRHCDFKNLAIMVLNIAIHLSFSEKILIYPVQHAIATAVSKSKYWSTSTEIGANATEQKIDFFGPIYSSLPFCLLFE